jgi:hypothetical protein
MAKPAFIRHSPEREAAIQRRLLDVAEANFRRKLAKVIRNESEQLIAKYRELGYVPAPTDDDFRAFKDVYLEIGQSTARAFGSRIVSQGKAAGLILETKVSFTDLFLSLATQWVNLEAIRRRITSVTETTRERIVRQVAAGQDEGLGVDAIAKRINKAVPKISRTRGALIARTETHGAANYAMHETAKTTGLDLVKEWVSVEDARTRSFGDDAEYNHVTMSGQQREMDEPFAMPWSGGDDLAIMYPGQAGLPGAATINCRCAVIHRVRGF